MPILLPPALLLQAPGQEPDAAQPDPRPLFRFRSQRLQEGLHLNQAQADAIAQRWGKFDQEHFQRQRQIGALRTRFNEILMGPDPEDRKSEQLKPLLAQFADLRHGQEEARHRFEEDIRAGLTPAQQARLILMVDDLNQRIIDALRERRQERRGF